MGEWVLVDERVGPSGWRAGPGGMGERVLVDEREREPWWMRAGLVDERAGQSSPPSAINLTGKAACWGTRIPPIFARLVLRLVSFFFFRDADGHGHPLSRPPPLHGPVLATVSLNPVRPPGPDLLH